MTGYTELYPRDWVPDLTRTGGDRPPSVVLIPTEAWVAAGRPESIEEWFDGQRKPRPAPGVFDVALTYAAVNDAALRQFINDAVAKERERVLEAIEREVSASALIGALSLVARRRLTDAIRRIREETHD